MVASPWAKKHVYTKAILPEIVVPLDPLFIRKFNKNLNPIQKLVLWSFHSVVWEIKIFKAFLIKTHLSGQNWILKQLGITKLWSVTSIISWNIETSFRCNNQESFITSLSMQPTTLICVCVLYACDGYMRSPYLSEGRKTWARAVDVNNAYRIAWLKTTISLLWL